MEKWLCPAFKELATTNRLSDCRFIIEAADGNKQIFECHKLIFSCASNVFERMFYGDFLESKSNEIVLKDVRPDIFAKFREYLYNYHTKLLEEYDETTLIDLARFGHQYMVSSVTEECIQILLKRTGKADVVILKQLYQFGNDILREDLIEEVWENMTNRFPNSIKQIAIYGLSSDDFFKHMEMTELKESMRFKMIENYLKVNDYKSDDIDQEDLKNILKNCSCFDTDQEDDKKTKQIVQFKNVKNTYIKKLLELIDYKKMTPQEFYNGPGKSEYFDIQEKYKMLFDTTFPK